MQTIWSTEKSWDAKAECKENAKAEAGEDANSSRGEGREGSQALVQTPAVLACHWLA